MTAFLVHIALISALFAGPDDACSGGILRGTVWIDHTASAERTVHVLTNDLARVIRSTRTGTDGRYELCGLPQGQAIALVVPHGDAAHIERVTVRIAGGLQKNLYVGRREHPLPEVLGGAPAEVGDSVPIRRFRDTASELSRAVSRSVRLEDPVGAGSRPSNRPPASYAERATGYGPEVDTRRTQPQATRYGPEVDTRRTQPQTTRTVLLSTRSSYPRRNESLHTAAEPRAPEAVRDRGNRARAAIEGPRSELTAASPLPPPASTPAERVEPERTSAPGPALRRTVLLVAGSPAARPYERTPDRHRTVSGATSGRVPISTASPSILNDSASGAAIPRSRPGFMDAAQSGAEQPGDIGAAIDSRMPSSDRSFRAAPPTARSFESVVPIGQTAYAQPAQARAADSPGGLPEAYRSSLAVRRVGYDASERLRIIRTASVVLYFAGTDPVYLRVTHPTTRCRIEFDGASLDGQAAVRTAAGTLLTSPSWGSLLVVRPSESSVALDLSRVRTCAGAPSLRLDRVGRQWRVAHSD